MTDTATKRDLIANDPRHDAALAFMKKVNGKANVDYEWVCEYSKTLWDNRQATFDYIDTKADGIIKYIGGGAALFALGLLAKADVTNYHIVAWSLPSFIFALLAVWSATYVRRPTPVPGMPAVNVAKSYADECESKSQAMGTFLGQWHLACVDMLIVNGDKSKWLNHATRCYLASIILLLLPVLAAIIWPPLKAAS